MLGDLFQVAVLGTTLVKNQIIDREEYLERLRKKKEDYNNMNDDEKYTHNIKVMYSGFHT